VGEEETREIQRKENANEAGPSAGKKDQGDLTRGGRKRDGLSLYTSKFREGGRGRTTKGKTNSRRRAMLKERDCLGTGAGHQKN